MWGIYFYAILFPYFFCAFAAGKFYCGYGNAAASVFPVQGAGEKGALPEGHFGKHGAFGFLADFLAAGVLVIISSAVSLPFNEYAPFSSVGAFLFATVGVVLAGVLIYFFHIKFVWKGILLEEGKKKKIALGMAILTAPYLMYLSPL